MKFRDFGTRNKGTFWEYVSALDFRDAKLPDTKFKIPLFLGYGVGIANKHAHDVDEIYKGVAVITDEFEKEIYTPAYFKNLQDMYVRGYKEIEKIVEKNKSRLVTMPSEELASDIGKIAVHIGTTHTPMLQGLYTMYLDEYYSQKLQAILKPEESTKIGEIKSLLLTTSRPSFTDLEETKIFEITDWYRKLHPQSDIQTVADKRSFDKFAETPEVRKKIKALVAKFGWFHMEYAFDPATEADYLDEIWKRLEGGVSAVSPIAIKKEIRKKQKAFFKSRTCPKKLLVDVEQLTYVLQEFAYILDHTKVVCVKGRFISWPIFKEAARRIGINDKDLLMLSAAEIADLLRTDIHADKKLIEERKQYRAVLLENGKIYVYSGKAAKELAEKLFEQDTSGESKEVKGIVAYPGIVRGKVTLVHSIHDKDRFKKGDILVTHDGSAELTLFLKTASAIVTDQGGMICHAAITAREIQTPCIVGTRNATKILKDGDIVEVDANRGIVKKLNK